MPCFTIIKDKSEINLNNDWVASTKFKSKDRFVDAKGKTVSSDYTGRQYRIIEKRERIFSTTERFVRGFLGTLMVVCSLSLALFSKSVRNLFVKSKENIRFAVLKEADPKKKLIEKIRALMPRILREYDDDIEFLKGTKVFKLKEMPHLVFKMGISRDRLVLLNGKWLNDKELMEERFANINKAREVCRVHGLGLLVIPQAEKFTFTTYDGKECVLIAEECMNINREEKAQEELYHKYSEELNETVRQLAILIAKTGFNDVSPRNIPLINEPEDFHGPRRVALIDLEHMGSIRNGFIGEGLNGSCGLIGCVGSEKQKDIIRDVARENGVNIDTEVNFEKQRLYRT